MKKYFLKQLSMKIMINNVYNLHLKVKLISNI